MNTVEWTGDKYYGNDEIHALSAWTSTHRYMDDGKRARVGDLLNMLATEGHHCYDDQTEILTKRGWVLFKDLIASDSVAAVDIQTGKCHFEIPSSIHADFHDGQMYYVNTQQLDLAVTAEHRMVVSQKRLKNGADYGFVWEFQTAKQMSGRSRKFLKAAQVDNDHQFTENQAKLLGFFIGDGYAASPITATFHLRKKRKIGYLKSLCDVRDLKNDCYATKDLPVPPKSCYTADKEKIIPVDIFSLSKRDVDCLIEGLKNSDGSCRKRNAEEWCFFTTSNALVEQLSILAPIHGFVFTNRKYTGNDNGGKWKKCFRLGFSKRIAPELSNMPSRPLGNDEWRHYSGMVYCVTVSTGAVIVRRNKKAVVSGNSPFEKSLFHFLFRVDTATHIHILKHRIGVSVSGESARYKELGAPTALIPADWPELLQDRLRRHHESCVQEYKDALKELTPILGRARAKESARFFLGYANQITLDVSFNWRSFAHFLGLRMKPNAQREIRELAEQMLELVKNLPGKPFERTIAAFGY